MHEPLAIRLIWISYVLRR